MHNTVTWTAVRGRQKQGFLEARFDSGKTPFYAFFCEKVFVGPNLEGAQRSLHEFINSLFVGLRWRCQMFFFFRSQANTFGASFSGQRPPDASREQARSQQKSKIHYFHSRALYDVTHTTWYHCISKHDNLTCVALWHDKKVHTSTSREDMKTTAAQHVKASNTLRSLARALRLTR